MKAVKVVLVVDVVHAAVVAAVVDAKIEQTVTSGPEKDRSRLLRLMNRAMIPPRRQNLGTTIVDRDRTAIQMKNRDPVVAGVGVAGVAEDAVEVMVKAPIATVRIVKPRAALRRKKIRIRRMSGRCQRTADQLMVPILTWKSL